MERKKIAIFSTGWTGEIIYDYIRGVYEGLSDISADLYLFLSHASHNTSESLRIGELNIYQLPNMEDFDAAIIYANSLNYPELLEEINQKCNAAGIPLIYAGKEDPRFYFVGSDNYTATRQLCEHLLLVHDVKKLWFIGGSEKNIDSLTRLKAVQDVLTEHNLCLSDDDICYTNWSPRNAYQYVLDRIQKGDALPDAIVCANDSLAMAICAKLRKINYKVPDDVLVTGFDNEMLAQYYDPAICSIDQRYDRMGLCSADILKKLFQGDHIERKHSIACEFIPSESCGCTAARDFDELRRKLGRDTFEDRVFNENFDMKLTELEKCILQSKTYAELGEGLQELNADPTVYEGNTFHVILDPLFQKTILNQQLSLRIEGYSDHMDAIFSKDKMLMQTNTEIRTRDLFPLLAPMEENRFFIICPLHDEEYSYGYIVLGDDIEKLKNSPRFRKYLDRFNIIFSKFYQNMRLDALNHLLRQMTETDALTRVKNRTAFEARLAKIQAEMDSTSKPIFGLALFDVNNLKKINDNLGHEVGDEYIINSTNLLCDTFKKSAIYRIGGDEFVIILQKDDFKNRNQLLGSLHAEMAKRQAEACELYEKVSIASGLAIYDPAIDHNVSDVFNRADALMYKNKELMKKQKLS